MNLFYLRSSNIAITLILFVALTGSILIGVTSSELTENNDQSSQSFEAEVKLVEESLNQIDSLLNKAHQQQEGNQDQQRQFIELRKHVKIIKDQLQLIQTEYQMNRDMDRFMKQMELWHQDTQNLAIRLKRDLESMYRS